MRILLAHNSYQYKGGEDSVFEDEKKLLEDNGHQVITYIRDNNEIKQYNIIQKLLFPINMIFSLKTYRKINKVIKKEKPDLIHVHNFFPLISPSIFFTKIPKVVTLHNYRLICPGAMLMRDQKVCELCLNDSLKNAVKYRCYRNSKILTFMLSLMLKIHKKTFQKRVSKYIALTEFNKKKLSSLIPPEKITVKPNFVRPSKKQSKKGQAVFVGRLSKEKGFQTLLNAISDKRIKVIGKGEFENQAGKNFDYLGFRSVDGCINEIASSQFLILPSEWYEGFPRTITEAFSVGTPVLASNLGNMQQIIKNGYTGILFKPGDSTDLKEKAEWLFNHPEECKKMGEYAYKEYQNHYTPEKNYKQLMKIYQEVINAKDK